MGQLNDAWYALPLHERERIRTNLQTGKFHLTLAIQALQSIPDTDTSDLDEILEDAEELLSDIQASFAGNP